MNSCWKLLFVLLVWGVGSSWPVLAADHQRSIRPHAQTGSASAVISPAPRLVQTSQLLPLDSQGKLAGPGNAQKQIDQTLENLRTLLQTSGSSLAGAVKLNFYVANEELVPQVEKTLALQFQHPALPAVSFVITRLPIPDALIAVDAIAPFNPAAQKEAQTIGAASRYLSTSLVTTQTLYYISGQAEKGTDLAEATRKTLLSLEATLKFCRRSKHDVRQVKCFLTPMSHIGDVRRELEAFYESHPIPPVSFIEWQSTLPIEFEVLADGTPDEGLEPVGNLVYLTPPGLTASPVFSRICRVHDTPLIFVSGLYGPAGTSGARQVESIFGELGEILKESGSDFTHLVKATYYVSQDEASQKLNELRPKYYHPQSPPSASKAQVTNVGRAGTGLTIDMIAIPKRNSSQK